MARQFASDPSDALQHIPAEDTRLLRRINAAAVELHRLWGEGWLADPEERVGRRARVAALQAAIDGLYAQRRQLVAQRALLRDPAVGRRRGAPLDLAAA